MGEYYWIQLSPKGTTDLRGYIVPADILEDAVEYLHDHGASRFVIWRLIPVEKHLFRKNGGMKGEYIVKRYTNGRVEREVVMI